MNLVATSPKSTMSSETLSSDSSLNFDRLNPLRSARALQPVVQLLRSHYPTGCLSADLIQVVQDQFVVQAKVQVEGISIVTALASASTVEVAEDRARTRALESLGISTTPSLNHALNTALSATVSLIPDLVKPEVVIPETLISETLVPEAIEPEISLPSIEDAAIEPKITKTSTKRKSKAAVAATEVLEVALNIAPEEAEVIEEVIEEVVVEALSEPSATESFEVTFEGGEVEYEYTFEEEETTPEVVPVPTFVPPVAMAPDLGLDLADAIAQIGGEIDRIGWTKKQGSGYLQDTYGKRTRAELTEAELFAFLAYLKSLPAKVQPDLSALPF